MEQYVAAVDLGTTKVVTIIGEKTPMGIKIIAYSEAPSKGIVRGEINNIQNVLDSLMPTILNAEEQAGIKIKDVFVGFTGQNIKCESVTSKKTRSTTMDLISPSEVEQMRSEMYSTRVETGDKVLHVIPQSYNVDDIMGAQNPEGMEGRVIEANYKLIVGNERSVEKSKDIIKRSGHKAKDLILNPLASAEAILTEDDKEIGVAVVDIGGGTTDILIYYDNTIRYTAVIPFGGNSVTEDIRQVCAITSKNAELVKIAHGSCLAKNAHENKNVAINNGDIRREIPLKEIAEIIEARMSEILATVKYHIEKSNYADKISAGIVFTGGVSRTHFLQHLAKQITGYGIRLAQPRNITPNSIEAILKPDASTAVGLVLMGFDYLENHQNIDTRPDVTTNNGRLFEEEIDIKENNKKSDGGKPKSPKRDTKTSIMDGFKGLFGSIDDEA